MLGARRGVMLWQGGCMDSTQLPKPSIRPPDLPKVVVPPMPPVIDEPAAAAEVPPPGDARVKLKVAKGGGPPVEAEDGMAPFNPRFLAALIDALMAAWKGKSGERLRGRLGLSESTRDASDGQVTFWIRRSEATACGVSEGGVIRCGVIGGSVCRLAVAFDKAGKVTNWKATGVGDACEPFIDEIGAPG